MLRRDVPCNIYLFTLHHMPLVAELLLAETPPQFHICAAMSSLENVAVMWYPLAYYMLGVIPYPEILDDPSASIYKKDLLPNRTDLHPYSKAYAYPVIAATHKKLLEA